MTVYSKQRSKIKEQYKTKETVSGHNGLLFLNSIIVILIVLSVGSMITMSNNVVANKYNLAKLQDSFNEISSISNNNQEISQISLPDLMKFAKNNGMIEDKSTESLFLDSGVALSGVFSN